MDESAPMFGICCCVPPRGLYTALRTFVPQYGTPSLTVILAGDFTTTVDGQRWTTFDTMVLQETPGGLVSIVGRIVVDNNNGSIATHTITPSTAPAGIVPISSCLPLSEAVSLTDRAATWAGGPDQSLSLSDPNDVGSCEVLSDSFLATVDIRTLTKGHIYLLEYPTQPDGGLLSVLGLPFAAYVLDTDGVTIVPGWVNESGQVLQDYLVPAYTAPVLATTDEGLFPDSPSQGPSTGPSAGSSYSNEEALFWAAQQLLVDKLAKLSNHCYQDDYDANAIAGGNTDGCGVVSADTSGELLLDRPPLAYSDSADGMACNRWLWLNYHPTVGGDGCPCLADI